MGASSDDRPGRADHDPTHPAPELNRYVGSLKPRGAVNSASPNGADILFQASLPDLMPIESDNPELRSRVNNGENVVAVLAYNGSFHADEELAVLFFE